MLVSNCLPFVKVEREASRPKHNFKPEVSKLRSLKLSQKQSKSQIELKRDYSQKYIKPKFEIIKSPKHKIEIGDKIKKKFIAKFDPKKARLNLEALSQHSSNLKGSLYKKIRNLNP